ncbi:MAG: 30S ribosomal protein S11 [Bacilli bacterium]|jgi:small subunit ribosomal protein S11|nr:30S ribosomal protein S11 [Bacilli bacterium]
MADEIKKPAAAAPSALKGPTAVAGAKKGKKTTIRKKKAKLNFIKGVCHIHASFSNTIISVTSEDGKVIAWASSGTCGMSGSKKSTPFAAQVAAASVAKSVFDRGLRQVDVEVKGPGPGRETAVRALEASGLKVLSIADVTPIPHNGCRPPKRPRG